MFSIDDRVETASARASLADLARRLAEDAGDVVKAYVALYRVQTVQRALAAGWAVGFALAALAIAGSTLTALLVGLIIWIGAALGTGWALLIVVGCALAVVAVLGWLSMRSFKALIGSGPEE